MEKRIALEKRGRDANQVSFLFPSFLFIGVSRDFRVKPKYREESSNA
jgi:hypothetical protein